VAGGCIQSALGGLDQTMGQVADGHQTSIESQGSGDAPRNDEPMHMMALLTAFICMNAPAYSFIVEHGPFGASRSFPSNNLLPVARASSCNGLFVHC
jgi:hypothetical protein